MKKVRLNAVVDLKKFADCIFLYPDLSGGTLFSLLFRTNSHINVFPLPLCTDTENSSHKTFLILKLHQVKKVVRCSNITQYIQSNYKSFKKFSRDPLNLYINVIYSPLSCILDIKIFNI